MKSTEHYVLPVGELGCWGPDTPSEQHRAHLDERNSLAETLYENYLEVKNKRDELRLVLQVTWTKTVLTVKPLHFVLRQNRP